MITARLQGGPYDGNRDQIEESTPEVYAWRCEHCGNVHIVLAPIPEALRRAVNLNMELYRFVKVDEKGVLYRYEETQVADLAA